MKSKNLKSEVLDTTEQGIVTIAISKFDVRDSYDDIVRKGAFTKTFKEGGHRIKHVMDHQLRQMAVVGLPLKMYENDTYAIVESRLNLEKQISRDLFSDYKFFKENGKTLEHSYMYETIKRNDNKEIKGEEITELKMYEYSTVALGANEHTPLMDIKSLGFEDVQKLEEFLRKNDVTNNKGKQIENIIAQIKALIEPQDTQQDEPVITLVADPEHEFYKNQLATIKTSRKWQIN